MKYLTGVLLIICAVIIAAFSVTKTLEQKNVLKNAGKTSGVVISTTSDRVILHAKSQIIYSALVKYEVDGKEYTGSVPLSNSAAPEKMIIYYDKNSPEIILGPRTNTKDNYILAAILALVGAAMLVWRRDE